jgi:hypothetical protein
MDLSYVTADMMIQVTYNPSFVSQSRPSTTENLMQEIETNSTGSWLRALYQRAILSERRQLITTAIKSEFYFSGIVTLTADLTDSYPFLGNATVTFPPLGSSQSQPLSDFLFSIPKVFCFSLSGRRD